MIRVIEQTDDQKRRRPLRQQTDMPIQQLTLNCRKGQEYKAGNEGGKTV